MDLNLISSEFDQCIKCGLCLATCPVNHELLLEKYTPRGKVQLARRYDRGDFALSDHYRDIFAKCMLCGACAVTCPSGVDLTKVFTHMREEIAAEKGIHPQMDPAVQSLLNHHNISGEDNEERGDWREDMKDLPVHQYEKDKADVGLFRGMRGLFLSHGAEYSPKYGNHFVSGPCGFHGPGRRGVVLRVSSGGSRCGASHEKIHSAQSGKGSSAQSEKNSILVPLLLPDLERILPP